jgi:hypothetical protein
MNLAQMGAGKAAIGAAAAYLAGFRSVLVLCPPHLVRWRREIVATVLLTQGIDIGISSVDGAI